MHLKDGDHVLWYYADFGPTGGPPTLAVKPAAKGCYTATAFDDNGKAADRRRPRLAHRLEATIGAGSTGKTFCPGQHPGVLVRATATGAVRSNAVK